jgi:glucoamylase
MTESNQAPGWPGIAPRWTSSAKSGVGTALSPSSRVWFTLGHGILNEIYYPRVDQACIRDLGLIVTDGHGFFSEEKRHTRHEVHQVGEGLPAYRLVNTCEEGWYRIVKEIVSDPARDALLQRVQFTPLRGALSGYHLYALLAPHLGNRGAGNSAWIGDYKGVPMLFARRAGYALAMASSGPWLKRSAGFVGVSDGWQDVKQHGEMTWTYERAANGNVALIGEVDLEAVQGEFTLALGFGRTPSEAGHRARAGLLDGFEAVRSAYIEGWLAWQREMESLPEEPDGRRDLYRISTAVLCTHEAKRFRGGLIASLSIPWGASKGDDDLGGYHLVWPRDLAESAGGLLAAGTERDVRRIVHYLQITQEADGHWPQNMWMDGLPYWNGIQIDETAFPILLVDLARREGRLSHKDLHRLWPMIQSAAGYVARNGPVTQQDRWEMDPGYSPFTLAVEIAALLAAADLADLESETEAADYLRDTADVWNANVERWIYVTGTDLDRQVGVEGHYVRIAPPEKANAASPRQGFVPIKSRPAEQAGGPPAYIVSPDALALVRFGLRSAHDPRIVNTVKCIDACLKIATPYGPAWRRYMEDQYGEHADGSPFDGSGTGRAWPLLTGERAHYELAAGREEEAEKLLDAMAAFANEGGLLPEQIWDGPDIPERELYLGRPSGSAMPLVWAHAEYVKLRRSLREGRVFDMPPQTVQRYQVEKRDTPYAVWQFNNKRDTLPAGKTLRIETLNPATVHWSADNWNTITDTPTRDTTLSVHVADLPTGRLPAGAEVVLTFYWPQAGTWEGRNYSVRVVASEAPEVEEQVERQRGEEQAPERRQE